jgi:hypothetical protein
MACIGGLRRSVFNGLSVEHVFRLEMGVAPSEILLLLGDFAYCLRSSLDHLAWQLALLSGDEPPSRTQFPSIGAPDREGQKTFRRFTKGIPTEALDIIRTFQPSAWPRLQVACSLGSKQIVQSGQALHDGCQMRFRRRQCAGKYYERARCSILRQRHRSGRAARVEGPSPIQPVAARDDHLRTTNRRTW